MDAFEQDPTAALAHVCLTTGIHVPGLNNLRRLSNGTCPEEGEQVAIDEAEKTLEALAASVSGAASTQLVLTSNAATPPKSWSLVLHAE